MKKYVLSGMSALSALRKLRTYNCEFSEAMPCEICRPSSEEAMQIANIFAFDYNYQSQNPTQFNKKIEFLVCGNRPQKPTKIMNLKYYSGCLNGVLLKAQKCTKINIPSSLLFVSPAFLLIQLSNILNKYDLLLLALEFCGTYTIGLSSITENDSNQFGEGLNENTLLYEQQGSQSTVKMYSVKNPIMKASDIDLILKACSQARTKGVCKIKQISKFIREGAASPMEARLYANLAMAASVGGFGINNLTFNHSIVLSKKAALVAQQQNVIVDLCHQKTKTVIEYDSRMFHSDVKQSQKDKRRRDGLEIDKYRCYSMTTEQFNNFNSFFQYAKEITSSIKGRFRIRTKNFEEKAFHLHSELRNASFTVCNL